MKVLILGPTLVLCCSSTAMAADWFVDDSIPTSGIGGSWSTAKKTFGEALSAASDGDNIFVGGGTYKPGTTRASTFTLKRCIIKGGYAGYGASDPWLINSTSTLSGDIGVANDYSDNCYHVVTASDGGMDDENTQLINFTITKGNGSEFGGGGVFIQGASPRIDKCIITANRSGDGVEPPPVSPEDDSGDGMFGSYGAGVQVLEGSPAFTRCVISDNLVNTDQFIYGGGVCVQGDNSEVGLGEARFINCAISGNIASRGGGIAVKTGATASMTNCLLHDNTAEEIGGGVSLDRTATMTVINCTIAENTAANGGGFAEYGSSGNAGVIVNSIIWDNDATTNPSISGSGTPGALLVTYTDVQLPTGTYGGTGNINTDPNFASDYQLNCISPAINAGNPMNTGVIPVDEFDLDSDTNATESTPDFLLNDREQGFPNEPDMGCYEKPYSAPACSGEANGICPVDVGDLLAVITSWGTCASPPCAADLTPKPCPDNLVNVADLLAVINNWCCTIPGCPTQCDGITIEDSQDCMDAASQLYTAFTEDWNNFVEKCIEMLENP